MVIVASLRLLPPRVLGAFTPKRSSAPRRTDDHLWKDVLGVFHGSSLVYLKSTD